MLRTDPNWAVERVVQQAAPFQWSPPHVVDSQLWVLPVMGLSEFRAAGQRVLLYGLTACVDGALKASPRKAKTSDQSTVLVMLS
jgi:hypothetical protein